MNLVIWSMPPTSSSADNRTLVTNNRLLGSRLRFPASQSSSSSRICFFSQLKSLAGETSRSRCLACKTV
ncbi:Uncharacterised protein [Mycobacterium tuberculosis]|nr:Uncharacterised protein [Mycobacterium tuberculosis]